MRENLRVSRNEKVQTGLRIPEKRYEELVTMADEAGISVNALVLLLVDVGLSAINLGTQAKRRKLLRNLRDTSE